MRITIKHETGEPLRLPINYHHILQSVIYHALDNTPGYGDYLHEKGAACGNRRFKLFTFGPIQGKYELHNKEITFSEQVSFTVSSLDTKVLQEVAKKLQKEGITYGRQHYEQVQVFFSDKTVEEEEIEIRMLAPICVYSTKPESGKTTFYGPKEEEFFKLVNDNFQRKYYACYGVWPDSNIELQLVRVTPRDKYVTSYKQTYLSGWKGKYLLCGKRKYLDFLYQTGLGSKNSQGFGMFEC